MRQLFLMALCLSSLTNLLAQSSLKWQGTVHTNDGKPLVLGHVELLRAQDSAVLKFEVANDSGLYEVTYDTAGVYLFKYGALQAKTVYSAPTAYRSGTTTTLPPITLIKEQTLKDASVVVKKPVIEVKADKLVFNVENSINATGSNAFDLLRKSPGVAVDNNDNISLKGKSGVSIMIDGKLSQLNGDDLMAFLKSLNSSDIEAIEIIANPGVKYDAAGTGGIINIRLKKNKKLGFNGNVSQTFMYGFSPKSQTTSSINYRNKKFNAFASVSDFIGYNQNGFLFNRTQRDTFFRQDAQTIHESNAFNGKAGVDYFMNNRNTIGVMASANYREPFNVSQNITDIIDPNNDKIVKKLDAFNFLTQKQLNTNYNFNYKYSDTNGREINIDVDYGQYRSAASSYQPNFYYTPNRDLISSVITENNTPTEIDIYSLKGDALNKIGKGTLGYGFKFSSVNTRNTFDFYTINNDVKKHILDKSNKFEYYENINAGYMNYQVALKEKWSLQAGMRMENTTTKGTLKRADTLKQADSLVNRQYTNLFPNFSIAYNANANNSFNLIYGKRIERPGYKELNPFEFKLDELTYEKGNAFLKPQYIHNIEFSHTYKSALTSSLTYSYGTDITAPITDTVGLASYVQERNVGTQQTLSASVSLMMPIRKWWFSYVNMNYAHQISDVVILNRPYQITIPTFSAGLQETFTLKNQWSIEVGGWYSGSSVWGATMRTMPQASFDCGVQKQLWHQKATAKLSATDVFFTAPWRAENAYTGLQIYGSGYWESRMLRLSFQYRFGSNQIKEARQRNTAADNELQRIGK